MLRVSISNAAVLAVLLYGCLSRFDLEALATMDDGCAMLTVLQRVSNSNAAMFDLNFLPAERR
ncbi:hypothetical protein B0T40_13105 [Chromobacterium haemolyticum]|uniref:Uncharacterized protein n=1 Tax=Chromobacterium rhizoryzae TaxID=1778675 RepID=A0AAD0WA13_9NEIS|nr:hypothetical protein D1345_23480 [Chromobacterium rhizoryzae]OQS35368.1 hypothetical protein B0T40_13105 [Chromobacterium haemolyticum]